VGQNSPAGKMKPTGADTMRRSTSARDPLLEASHKKVARSKILAGGKNKGVARIVQITVHIIVPFMAYIFMLFLTMYNYYKSPFAVWLTLFITVLVSYCQYFMIEHCKKKWTWQKWIGVYSSVALVLGFAFGLVIHYNFMLFYYKYTYMTKYSNVAASQPVLQFEDASTILFTEGTRVDGTRGVGYHSTRSSKTLCVAPVVDSQMATTDPIVFWAVGTGCCSWRASFNCDDAKGGGRTGMLVLRPDQLVSSSMKWTVEEKFDFEGFDNAIEMATSVFAMTAGKEKRLVRWVKVAKKDIDDYRKRGLEAALFLCLGFLFFAAICAAREVMNDRRKQQELAEQLTGLDDNA
jgi:hypothetical protein